MPWVSKLNSCKALRNALRLDRYVATPLLKASTASDVMQKEIAKIPVGRIAEMEEIGDAISLLVSPLSSYMNGASLVADG